MTQQIAITGANGHLGTQLLRHLSASTNQRYAVRAIVRSERARSALTAANAAAPEDIVVTDYGDATAMASALAGCTAVVHLVGILKATATNTYEQAHERPATALATALAAMPEPPSTVVMLSILGAHSGHRNPCLASKGRAEDILCAAPGNSVILQVPMVIGENDYATRALANKAKSTRTFLTNSGRTLEQPIYAGDVVAAIVASLALPAQQQPVRFALTGPESLPHAQLVARAARLLGRSPPAVVGVPLFAVRALAWLLERMLANPPLTSAMLGVLEHDDQVDSEPACTALGIELTPLDEMLRRVLVA